MPNLSEIHFGDRDQILEVPVAYQQVGQDQTASWGTLTASITAHVYSVVRVQNYLRRFYRSVVSKVKARNLKQAKMATLNKGVSMLLKSAGCKDKWIEDEDENY
ncbi:hypothetical protein BGX27_001299 [Mortierella sp. AM989]|nr:hypothetical protein BGX27_001299 [Mortierella sp. AM989]